MILESHKLNIPKEWIYDSELIPSRSIDFRCKRCGYHKTE